MEKYVCNSFKSLKNRGHLTNFQSWKKLKLRLRHKKTIDAKHLLLVEKEDKYWQEILKRLIALVRVLGMQILVFRGTHERLHTSVNATS